jgi:hypothetical protein
MERIFRKVIEAIIANSKSKLTCSVEFVQNPSKAPKSVDKYGATRPDGYMLVKDRLDKQNVSWGDVVLSCEYKRKDRIKDLNDACILRELR